jgi:hypothetical protein
MSEGGFDFTLAQRKLTIIVALADQKHFFESGYVEVISL